MYAMTGFDVNDSHHLIIWKAHNSRNLSDFLGKFEYINIPDLPRTHTDSYHSNVWRPLPIEPDSRGIVISKWGINREKMQSEKKDHYFDRTQWENILLDNRSQMAEMQHQGRMEMSVWSCQGGEDTRSRPWVGGGCGSDWLWAHLNWHPYQGLRVRVPPSRPWRGINTQDRSAPPHPYSIPISIAMPRSMVQVVSSTSSGSPHAWRRGEVGATIAPMTPTYA